jgi:hypothetical protein
MSRVEQQGNYRIRAGIVYRIDGTLDDKTRNHDADDNEMYRERVEPPLIFVHHTYSTLDDAFQGSDIKVRAYSIDGKHAIGVTGDKGGIEKVLAQYDRFKKSAVAQKFVEKHGQEPQYDGILYGQINNANALGANILTNDGKQYLMVDERYAASLDERTWDQVFSHEWHHNVGIHDEVQTSTLNGKLYEELADNSSGILRDSYLRNAQEEAVRAQYQTGKSRYAA